MADSFKSASLICASMAAYEGLLLRGVAAVSRAVANTVEVTTVEAATSYKSRLQTSNFVGKNNARLKVSEE